MCASAGAEGSPRAEKWGRSAENTRAIRCVVVIHDAEASLIICSFCEVLENNPCACRGSGAELGHRRVVAALFGAVAAVPVAVVLLVVPELRAALSGAYIFVVTITAWGNPKVRFLWVSSSVRWSKEGLKLPARGEDLKEEEPQSPRRGGAGSCLLLGGFSPSDK